MATDPTGAWLTSSSGELAVADALLTQAEEAGEPFLEAALLHAHRAAEWALGAFLAARQRPLDPRDLMVLAGRAAEVDPGLRPDLAELADLAAYGAGPGAPGAGGGLAFEEVARRVGIARHLLIAVRERI